MSQAVEFPDLDVSFRGGGMNVETATAILVGIALAALIGLRLSFPKG
jgi:hypothetical protein